MALCSICGRPLDKTGAPLSPSTDCGGDCWACVSRIENEINESSIMSKFRYYEVTAHGFDGGTDETDDSVLWVKYDLSATAASMADVVVNTIADAVDATVVVLPDVHIDGSKDVDFHLPSELLNMKKRLTLLKHKNVLRTTKMEPRPVSEQARALVDRVWVAASTNAKTEGAHAIDKLMAYIQQLENNQNV
jgi:hypothetical protein